MIYVLSWQHIFFTISSKNNEPHFFLRISSDSPSWLALNSSCGCHLSEDPRSPCMIILYLTLTQLKFGKETYYTSFYAADSWIYSLHWIREVLVCVFMCVCVCVCLHMFLCTCVCVYVSACICLCICVCVYVFVHMCLWEGRAYVLVSYFLDVLNK